MYLDSMINEGAQPRMASTGTIEDMNALMENFIYADIAALDEESRKQFLVSDTCKALQEAGILGKKTIVRLNKADDLTKRIEVAIMQKAKEDGDPNYLALKKLMAKKKALKAKLNAKYYNRVKNDAVKAQRALIKINPHAFTSIIR